MFIKLMTKIGRQHNGFIARWADTPVPYPPMPPFVPPGITIGP